VWEPKLIRTNKPSNNLSGYKELQIYTLEKETIAHSTYFQFELIFHKIYCLFG
jgi:hypothetical protein